MPEPQTVEEYTQEILRRAKAMDAAHKLRNLANGVAEEPKKPFSGGRFLEQSIYDCDPPRHRPRFGGLSR
jgi:hypothetical protein